MIENWIDKIKELLARPVWGSVTVLHLLIALVVLYLAWKIIERVHYAFRDKKSQHFVEARCSTCGWTGRVSAHVRQCPQCNSQRFHPVSS